MREEEQLPSKTVLGLAKKCGLAALNVSHQFFLDFRIGRSLHLAPEQCDVFLAYFAHYWVRKKDVHPERWARKPMSGLMEKVPFLKSIAKFNFNVNDGVNLVSDSLLEMAKVYSEKLKDGSHADIRNAANILSSVYLEGLEGEELNQKVDGALSRIKIGKIPRQRNN